VSVDTNQRQLAAPPEFVTLDTLRWHDLEIDASDLESGPELVDFLTEQVQATCEQATDHEHIVRLTLTGRTALYHDLATSDLINVALEGLRKQLAYHSPMVLIDALADSTAPPIDLQRRAGADDLAGQLLAVADEIGADPARLMELENTLQPLWRHATLKRVLETPTHEQLHNWLTQGAGLCVDLLEGDQDS
jgi:hypothetical protein